MHKHIDIAAKIEFQKFPTLEKCMEIAAASLSSKKLNETEKHLVGTVWAFIEGEITGEVE